MFDDYDSNDSYSCAIDEKCHNFKELHYLLRHRKSWSREKCDALDFELTAELQAQINATNEYLWTPLMLAAATGYIIMVEKLILGGATINIKNNKGRTALHLASRYSIHKSSLDPQNTYRGVIKLLLNADACPNLQDNDLCTPLHYIISDYSKSHYIIRNSHSDFITNTAFMIKLFIDAGANLEIKNNFGHTVLWTTNWMVAEQLLKYGANPNAVDKYSESILIWCAKNDLVGNIDILLKYAANPDSVDKNGRSALMWAVDSPQIVQTLLIHGAKPNIQNSTGRTALMFAAESSAISAAESMRVLLNYDADPNLQDSTKNTALDIAIANYNTSGVNILLITADLKLLSGNTLLYLLSQDLAEDTLFILLEKINKINKLTNDDEIGIPKITIKNILNKYIDIRDENRKLTREIREYTAITNTLTGLPPDSASAEYLAVKSDFAAAASANKK